MNKQNAKCKYCEEIIEKGTGIKYGNRFFHPNCLTKEKDEKKKRIQQRKENGKTEEWKELLDFIDFHLKENQLEFTSFIPQQIQKYTKEPYNYKYTGMLLTLKYIIQEQKDEFNQYSIFKIPYYYDKLKEEYNYNKQINKENQDIIKKNIQKIIIKKIKKKNKRYNSQFKSLIDLELEDL